jgi:hypothetical protein
MRWLACVAVVWLACDGGDGRPRALRTKHVDELQERDRGELIRLEGRVSNAVISRSRTCGLR